MFRGFFRTDVSRIFIFEPPDFFADFVAGFFLLIFVGKSAQKNPPGKSPGKSSKIYTTKNPPTHFCRLPRAKSEEDKRATTNVQNDLVFFLFFSLLFSFLIFELKQQ